MSNTGPCAPAVIELEVSKLDRPLLSVIVDTEEEFDWSGPFSRRHVSVDSLMHIWRGHEILRRYGLQPAYLLDYPVVADPRSLEVFGPWLERGECHIGAQLHPWVTPPHEEVVCPFNSYPCNLDPELERRKLEILTVKVRERFGIMPRIYKAGRYGLDIRREGTLVELGYEVDTSVMPFRNFSGLGGGPNFFGYPDRPFWASAERRLLYLPVTQSLVGPIRSLGRDKLGEAIFGRLSSRLRLPGILARLRLLERIVLSPESASFEEMRRLVDCQMRAGNRIFALSLHSPSFMSGGTPYSRSARDVDELLTRTDRFLGYFARDLRGLPISPLRLPKLSSEPHDEEVSSEA